MTQELSKTYGFKLTAISDTVFDLVDPVSPFLWTRFILSSCVLRLSLHFPVSKRPFKLVASFHQGLN